MTASSLSRPIDTLARPILARLAVILVAVPLGCNGGGTPDGSGGSDSTGASNTGSSTTGSDSTGSDSTGSDSTGSTQGNGAVACDDAKDGDPCDVPSQSCGPTECYGCFKQCLNDHWKVTCNPAPTCETVTIAQEGPCDDFCLHLECGPFDVTTACGDVSASATCGLFGWYYELPCDPDCESLSQSTCEATSGCAWAVLCTDISTPALSPRCIDFPPPNGTCDNFTCPPGKTCVAVGLGFPVSSGTCADAGALVPLCVDP